MKKNFFKKLAFFMALAMVITAISPATFAGAAAAPKIDATSKTLYVKGTYDFAILNKVAKSTYKWASSDAKVAKVDAKTGLTTAVAPGKATISCTITLPTKKTTTVKAVVTVKQKATAVKVNNYTEGMTINVGEKAFDFNLTKTPAKATSASFWMINEATNTAGATHVANGVVNTTKVGEFEIKAVLAESAAAFEAGNYTTETEWLKVKVEAVPTGAQQVSDKKVDVTFNTNIKDIVKTSDFELVDVATNVKQAIKAVTISDNGLTATIETYVNLVDAKDYKVVYGAKEFKFTASVGAVNSIAVVEKEITHNTATKITYKVFDKNGMELSSSSYDSSRIDVSIDAGGNGYVDAEGKLILFAKGDTAKVTVVYHTYTYANNEEIQVKAEGIVTAVDAKEVTVGNYEKYTIASSTPNWDKDTMNTQISLSDSAKSVYLRVKDSEGNYLAASDIKYSSTDNNVLVVGEDGSLYPVKAGSAQIVASYGTKATWLLNVTVLAERKATSIYVDGKTSISLSNSAAIVGGDSATVEVKLKDQFSSDFAVKSLSVELLNQVALVNAGKTVPTFTQDGSKVTFNAASATAGDYTYKFTSEDKIVTFVVKVQAPGAGTTQYKIILSDTTIDNAVASDATNVDDKKVVAKVAEYKNGILYAYSSTADITIKNASGTIVATGSSIDGATFATATGASVVVKQATGTYSVSAKVNGVTINSAFIVKDTQAVPTATLKEINSDELVSGSEDAVAVKKIVEKCFEIKDANGTKIDTVDSVEFKIVGNQLVVKTIKVTQDFGTLKVTFDLSVNKIITLKNIAAK